MLHWYFMHLAVISANSMLAGSGHAGQMLLSWLFVCQEERPFLAQLGVTIHHRKDALYLRTTEDAHQSQRVVSNLHTIDYHFSTVVLETIGQICGELFCDITDRDAYSTGNQDCCNIPNPEHLWVQDNKIPYVWQLVG